MRLVNCNPDLIAEFEPFTDQDEELVDLARVFLGDAIEEIDLGLNERSVFGCYPVARSCQLLEALQSMAAQDDALIGFVWGHGAQVDPDQASGQGRYQ